MDQKLIEALDDAFRIPAHTLNAQCRIILDDIEALVVEAEGSKDWRRVREIGQAVRLKFERLAQIVKEAGN